MRFLNAWKLVAAETQMNKICLNCEFLMILIKINNNMSNIFYFYVLIIYFLAQGKCMKSKKDAFLFFEINETLKEVKQRRIFNFAFNKWKKLNAMVLSKTSAIKVFHSSKFFNFFYITWEF